VPDWLQTLALPKITGPRMFGRQNLGFGLVPGDVLIIVAGIGLLIIVVLAF